MTLSLKKIAVFILAWLAATALASFLFAIMTNLALYFDWITINNENGHNEYITMGVYSWVAVALLSLFCYFLPVRMKWAGLAVAAFLPALFSLTYALTL
jgi:hypothetical protein